MLGHRAYGTFWLRCRRVAVRAPPPGSLQTFKGLVSAAFPDDTESIADIGPSG